MDFDCNLITFLHKHGIIYAREQLTNLNTGFKYYEIKVNTMITIYVDAARDIKTGQSAAGAVIVINKQQRQLKSLLPDTKDNQEAEFRALIWVLKMCATSTDMIQLYSDSQLLIDAINKNYAKHYQIYVDEISALLKSHALLLSQWLPEKENLGAHKLALQALQQKKTIK